MSKANSSNIDVKIKKFISGIFMATVISVSGCATTKDSEQNLSTNKDDPYENFNRKVFTFNDNVDDYVAKPISDGYKWVTPQLVQTGVFNFFNNLKNINVVINDALQAKFAQSAQDTGRLAINTTLGLGGIFDVAKHVGLEQNEEDFDQTLAVWGVSHGSYLVIPFLGPSTVRGVPGAAFDTAANPSTYIGFPIMAASLINTRATAEGSLQFIDEAALDPYIFTRESFLQWRDNLATDGKSQTSNDVDDLDNELLADDKDTAVKPGLPINASKAEPTKDKKTNPFVSLEAESKQLEKTSKSLSDTTKSLDNSTQSLENADSKIDKLKRSKK